MKREGMIPSVIDTCVRYTSHAPSHGPGMWWMECTVCGATWVGLTGEECGWCLRRYLRQLADERVRLLAKRPDESDEAWIRRMWSGQQRGVIRRHEIERAMRHESQKPV